jgi:DNA-binding response OmpR family regulator
VGILIIENHHRLAALVRRVLAEDGHAVDVAHDAIRGAQLASKHRYDLVILDHAALDADNVSPYENLRGFCSDAPLLMLTDGSTADRRERFEVGDDYLVKPFPMGRLLARVDALLGLHGQKSYPSTELKLGDVSLDLIGHEARRGSKVIDLTGREFSLLEYLMRHPHRVLTRNQILEHVWRYDVHWKSNVVDSHIRRLRDKMDRGFSCRLIKTVRGVGYKIAA